MNASDTKNARLVNQLLDGTRKREVDWRATPAMDVFVAVLRSGSVEISRHLYRDPEDGIPAEWFELAILTDRGAVADRISSSPHLSGDAATNDGARNLDDLYKAARAMALNCEGIVDSMIAELQGAP